MVLFAKQFFVVAIIILFSCSTNMDEKEILTTIDSSYSSNFVKDSFDISITLPPGYNSSSQNFPVVYYLDGNMRSGKELREILSEFAEQHHSVNAVFVGIGHIGNNKKLRQRDYIIPKSTELSLAGNKKGYGQVENFYAFLKNELIPFVEKNYRVTQRRSLIGHSLGGLCCVYCLFKKERLFTNFVAVSPSLWINRNRIYEYEAFYRKDSTSLHANFYLTAGSRERLNYILSGARKMKKHLEEQRYTGLTVHYHEIAGKSHHNSVPVALKKILHDLD